MEGQNPDQLDYTCFFRHKTERDSKIDDTNNHVVIFGLFAVRRSILNFSILLPNS